jgi:ribosomal protein S21
VITLTKVIRRDNENVESLLRRFIRNVQQSKVLTIKKERTRRQKPLKRQVKRVMAIKKAARLKKRLLK